MSDLQLVVAICKARGDGGARHWILMLAEDNAESATWYHSTGGPTQGKPYSVEIAMKRFRSQGVDKHYKIATIPAKEKNKVKAAVQNTTAKFCQRWVVDVLASLEKKTLVPQGTADTWYKAMEVDPYSDDGAPRPKGSSSQATKPSASSAASSSSAAAKSSSASSSKSKVEWVWDDKAKRYKYWDASAKKWVWQQ
ncbi:hypothetical protein C8A03DRAFT_37115 [Achaetomium macrosporum]|uniref:Uncharacterized protein n=1 Tax=Achaetomium macrosporum TaxID=79813 RepID=A0AAN7C5D9_9PEZI|nr:hypothetical protein C8A03DRAFT_37115 [Achaetomium macrosporum]